MLKTLNFYVAKNFLYTFVMAMGVLTFGMTGARLVKVFEYVSNGVDIGTDNAQDQRLFFHCDTTSFPISSESKTSLFYIYNLY